MKLETNHFRENVSVWPLRVDADLTAPNQSFSQLIKPLENLQMLPDMSLSIFPLLGSDFLAKSLEICATVA